jgi:sugar phosphate isomerase/epimerase
MRDLGDHRWMSLNTATVRKQGALLDIIEACARHGIRAIDPWRDQVAATGIDRAAKAIRDAGLQLSGYCRGGMFTADAAHRIEARDDNRRAVDEAKALGAPCLCWFGGPPQYSRPGSTPGRISPPRMRRSRTASRSFSNMPARPECRWRSSRCIR